jgi:hypothetical protein
MRTAPPTPIVPTIHLNGTSGQDLKAEYYAAYEAIERAVEALAAATLNARDFYVQSADAYYQAREQRAEAFDKLRQVQDYVEGMLVGIINQTSTPW